MEEKVKGAPSELTQVINYLYVSLFRRGEVCLPIQTKMEEKVKGITQLNPV